MRDCVGEGRYEAKERAKREGERSLGCGCLGAIAEVVGGGVWVGRDDLCVAEVGHDRLENSVIHRLCALHNSQ